MCLEQGSPIADCLVKRWDFKMATLVDQMKNISKTENMMWALEYQGPGKKTFIQKEKVY